MKRNQALLIFVATVARFHFAQGRVKAHGSAKKVMAIILLRQASSH